MSDRREFLKGAGIMGLASFSKALPVESGEEAATKEKSHTGKTSHREAPREIEADAVVLENSEMRLTISARGVARSLIHKPTGQECLAENTDVPMFNVTQYRPYDNELQLAYPAKITHFPVDRVQREGNRLIVDFALVGYKATIELKIADAYIAFRLAELTYDGYTPLITNKWKTPIDETLFLQLPVRNRKNLGEWLNVMWDEEVAVNVLATDPHTRINAEPCTGYRLFQAGTVAEVQLEGPSAALIATTPSHLLDRIASVEEDFNLPRGVASRRSKEYRYSSYEVLSMTPQDADEHIHFAKMGGFRLMPIYHPAFAKSMGHFPWRKEYPRGMADLQEITDNIRKAGIIPGFHILFTMANTDDTYVTPIPDPRLGLKRSFTLAEPIDRAATAIPVEENPHLCTMQKGMRVLRIQNELIRYERFTTTPPYRFEGCERGALGTQVTPHETSSRVGLLDMYAPEFVRYNQDTTLQAEVAERLQAIYEQAGFRFLYFDGSEQVTPPYWYTISNAQLTVQKPLVPQPLFAEGSCKTHFSWHITTRGNAFDIFHPEVVKAATRAYTVQEIERVSKDFSSIDFGWLGYWAPSEKTIGTQPDMLEYVTSIAASWNCPVTFFGELPALRAHPRTPDNLEVLRRWEDVRAQDWLTHDQKMSIRNVQQEHTLLIDERGKFVLVPYEQIEDVAGAKTPGRAFVFERKGRVWVTYWHTSGEGFLELPLPAKQLRLMRELGKPLPIHGSDTTTTLPLGERRYLEFNNLSRQDAIQAFQNARILT